MIHARHQFAILSAMLLAAVAVGCGGANADPSAREVAEWVLAKGGTVHTTVSDLEVKPGTPLPEGEFGLLRINLNEIPLQDADLEKLAALTNLRYLGLHRTDISDAGLNHLAGLKTLTELELSYNRITDAGLETLKSLPKLEKLFLYSTDVTDEGVESFRRQRDAVTIYR